MTYVHTQAMVVKHKKAGHNDKIVLKSIDKHFNCLAQQRIAVKTSIMVDEGDVEKARVAMRYICFRKCAIVSLSTHHVCTIYAVVSYRSAIS